MKSILMIALAASALSGAAAAQPAWRPSEGGPPDHYPPCGHYGQDRCRPAAEYGGGYEGRYAYGYRAWRQDGYWRHHHRHVYARPYRHRYHGHSSTDGERG